MKDPETNQMIQLASLVAMLLRHEETDVEI